ncbi:MAG: tetratricopeptide repeat protein, partial [Candidatus Caenarcaniphilales bacterium]|nr:tetratricopeptide repeat protein [Candidatus Caenarcaniphilales bacterium]
QKKYDYAEKYYAKALQLDPKEVQALNNFAFLKVETGDFTEAERLYKLAIEKDPDYVYSYSNLASLYKKIGKMFSAVAFYKKALDRLPGPEMYYRLSLVYYDMKRYDDMLETLNLALKEDMTYPEAYYSLAFVHFRNLMDYEPEKREAEFKKAFNELVRLNKPMAEEFSEKYLKTLKKSS